MISTCAALLLTAPAMLYVRLSGGAFLAHVVRSEATPGVYFAMGWGFLALTEMAGFFIALSAWWARRR
jgi:hypothetical protein